MRTFDWSVLGGKKKRICDHINNTRNSTVPVVTQKKSEVGDKVRWDNYGTSVYQIESPNPHIYDVLCFFKTDARDVIFFPLFVSQNLPPFFDE